MRLPRLGQSPVAALASADLRHEVVPGLLASPPSQPVPPRLVHQRVHKSASRPAASCRPASPPDLAHNGHGRSVGVGTSSRTVHYWRCSRPTFQSCTYLSGVVRRLGSSINSSRSGRGIHPDLPRAGCRTPYSRHHSRSWSSRENGVWGVTRRVREGRGAVRVWGDNTGGAAPWDRCPGRESRRERPSRITDRPSAYRV